MLREEMHRIITSRFYQSLSESDIEIRAIPQQELQAMINALADGLIDALDQLEQEEVQSREVADTVAGSGGSTEEELIWTGRPYLSIGVRYELTTQRLRIIRGLLGRSIEEVELVRVRDTSVSQHLGERTLNVGDIVIASNDPSHPEVTLHNVREPMEVREKLRSAVIADKKRHGIRYQEEM